MRCSLSHARLAAKYCDFALLDAVSKYIPLLHSSKNKLSLALWYGTGSLTQRLLLYDAFGYVNTGS